MKRMLDVVVAALALTVLPALAQVTVGDAWVRATVPAQTATAGFVTLGSDEQAALVGAASPVAGVVEIHEMSMQGDVARMRRIERLALPVGRTVRMRPDGYHLMLMELKRPLHVGEMVPITLHIERADGTVEAREVHAIVQALSDRAAAHSADHAGTRSDPHSDPHSHAMPGH